MSGFRPNIIEACLVWAIAAFFLAHAFIVGFPRIPQIVKYLVTAIALISVVVWLRNPVIEEYKREHGVVATNGARSGPVGVYNAETGKFFSTCSVIAVPDGTAIDNHGEVVADHLSINAPSSCTPSQKKIGAIDVLITETAEPSVRHTVWTRFSMYVLREEFDEQAAKDFAAQADMERKIEFLKKLKESVRP